MAPGRLDGKVALITGAGSGMGRSAAVLFTHEGANVVCADIRSDAAQEVADECGGESLPLPMDVTSRESVTSGIGEAVGALGGIDILVNNVGLGFPSIAGTVFDTSEEIWDRGIALNLTSVYLVTRTAWPHLVARGGGAIVNTASYIGMWGNPGLAVYCTAKAGVIMLTKCMALDGAQFNIRANCVCPGHVDTPWLRSIIDDQEHPAQFKRTLEGTIPLGSVGESEDIAHAMLYLASSDSKWVTGTSLVVDGGVMSGVWGGQEVR